MKGVGLRGSPFPPLVFTGPADMGKTFVPVKTTEGLTRMSRPVLLRNLTNGRCVVVVNFATEKTLELLQMAQIGAVPCNNPNCEGGLHGWETDAVRWQTETTAPLLFIDKAGNCTC